jgi:VanZ family protein
MSSGTGDNVTDFMNRILSFLKIGIDPKILRSYLNIIGHMFEFFFLALFIYGFVFECKLHYPHFLALSICLFLGLIDEGLQGLVQGRVSSVGDVFVDLIGAGFGILIIIINKPFSNKILKLGEGLY